MKGPIIIMSQEWLDMNPCMEDVMMDDPDLFMSMILDHPLSMPAERIALKEMDGRKLKIQRWRGRVTINPVD